MSSQTENQELRTAWPPVLLSYISCYFSLYQLLELLQSLCQLLQLLQSLCQLLQLFQSLCQLLQLVLTDISKVVEEP